MADTTTDDTGRNGIQRLWQDRILAAKAAKKTGDVIPRMLVELAFAAGDTWHVWDRAARKVRRIDEVDPRYADRELYSVNLIREYREAQLGELASDDDRPQLLVAQDGETAEDAAKQLNQAADYAWRNEWDADKALRRARAYTVDNGVSAIRCRWNPDAGNRVGTVPLDDNGQPIDAQHPAFEHLRQTGRLPSGQTPRMKVVREGRTEWQAYSALQILPPPGCVHEDEFPWEILMDVALVDDLKTEYGDAAAGLQEDLDIANAMGMTAGQDGTAGRQPQSRLRGHCWRYLCFQRPSKRWPEGRTAVVASNQHVLLDHKDELPYRTPGGQPDPGVRYLHWWRKSDSIWSASLIGALKDPQRIVNRRETQNLEIIDRGMPKTYVVEGQLPETPTGAPMEMVALKNAPGAVPPTVFAGIGPNDWMWKDLDHQAQNLSHASTLSPLRLGENPPSVDTYSQLALLNENEAVKRSVIQIEHRAAVAALVELGVTDIGRYWPEEKQILVSGDDDEITTATFRKSTIPPFFMAKVPTGAPKPRSQGAELKKVDAVWQAAVESTVTATDPAAWTDWYHRSIEAGSVQDLPEPPKDSQQQFARLENLVMRDGQPMPVMDYDLLPVHLPEHREAQDQARAAGDMQWLARLDAHVKAHVRQAQENAANVAQITAGAQPPDGPPPPEPDGPLGPEPQPGLPPTAAPPPAAEAA